MTDTPTKRPAKKAAARPRARGAEDETAEPDIPVSDDDVFIIPAVVRRYRYLFAGGRIMDVESPYQSNSTDREKVLAEAQRRWGGKKDDWRIEGSTVLPDA